MDKRPLRGGLVFLSAALALTAMLLTGCGGSDPRTKVEASLRHYLSTPYPQPCLNSPAFCPQSQFPLGAGPPRVRENSCKKTDTGRSGFPSAARPDSPPALPEGLTFWSCVVTFGKAAVPVTVLVKRSGEVYLANLMSQAAPPRPATVYEGGP